MKTTKELLEEKAKLEEEFNSLSEKIKEIDKDLLESYTDTEFIDSLKLTTLEREVLDKISNTWEVNKLNTVPRPYLYYTKTENGITATIEISSPTNNSSYIYYLNVFDSENEELFSEKFYDLEELESYLEDCFSMVEVKYNIPTIYQHHKLKFKEAKVNNQLSIGFLIDENKDISERILSQRDLTYNPEKDLWE